MKKLLILLLCSALFYSDPVFGWGREGHETIAKIAERNLTKRAKKRIEKYLGGHSVVYYAKWMDEYRKTPEYAFTDGWHTAPVDARLHYSDELLNRNAAMPSTDWNPPYASSKITGSKAIPPWPSTSNTSFIWWATCTAPRTSSMRPTT